MYKIDLIWRKMNTLFSVPTGNMQNTVISQQSQHLFLRKMAMSLTLPWCTTSMKERNTIYIVSLKKNPQTKKPFILTASSTRRSTEAKVKHPMGPSAIYDKVFEEAGGMIEVEAVSNVPRNIKQVKNTRAKLKRISSDEDEFYPLLALGRDTAGLCIKGLQWTPSPRVVYVEEWQMAEIVENCCQPDSASVLSIDTTFNVGQFYITSTTYQNPKFINQRTGKFVNVTGPALFHVRQDETQFLFFCNTLLEANYEFEKVRFVGRGVTRDRRGF